MCDVGGQRSERKKWIHYFDNVTAVLFVTSLSEYDQMLYEDETQNRMLESLKLFAEICNSKHFVNKSMILFLNKRDLFQEKLPRSPLNKTFPDYTGGADYDLACRYISEQFTSLNVDPAKRTVYVHITCATDASNIQYVVSAVTDMVMRQKFKDVGFL
eukprot:TRINITY_DN2906_c0_g1_i1.p2 TRINITY_DN2906_c0_g1~~TRINITY_DN2906_c0_g1_i1.p2  ORF type:complete len:158 (-),score=39.77 TRINITY_DN2906_c0_g1_i1:37-510(-)